MKILAKATAMLVPMAVSCVCKYLPLLNWNEFSFKISLSAFPSKRLGMGCLHVIVESFESCAFYVYSRFLWYLYVK